MLGVVAVADIDPQLEDGVVFATVAVVVVFDASVPVPSSSPHAEAPSASTAARPMITRAFLIPMGERYEALTTRVETHRRNTIAPNPQPTA